MSLSDFSSVTRLSRTATRRTSLVPQRQATRPPLAGSVGRTQQPAPFPARSQWQRRIGNFRNTADRFRTQGKACCQSRLRLRRRRSWLSLRRVVSICKHLCHVFLTSRASIGDSRKLMCGQASCEGWRLSPQRTRKTRQPSPSAQGRPRRWPTVRPLVPHR